MKRSAHKETKSLPSASPTIRLSMLILLDKAILLLILTLLFLTPLFLIPRIVTHDTVIHVKNLLAHFTLSTLAILSIIRLFFFYGNDAIHHDPVRILLCLFSIAILISCLLSREVVYSLHHAVFAWSYHLMFLVMPAIFLSKSLRNKKRIGGNLSFLNKMRIVICFTGFLVAVYGLCQYFEMDFIFKWFRYDIKDKIARNYIISTIGNPEYLGSYLAPLVLLCLPELLENRHWGIRLLAFVAIIVFISALLLSGTRGALLAMGAGTIPILVFIYREAHARKRFRILATLGSLGVFMIAFLVIFSFPNPLNRHNQAILQRFKNLANLHSTSMKERILFYSIGSELITRAPAFGVGEGMFRVSFYPALEWLSEKDDRGGVSRFLVELKNRVAENAHNDFLQIWIENGTVGFLIFTLTMTFLFAQAFSLVFRKTLPLKERRLLGAFSAAALCLFLNATFSFPMHTPARSALFWCLLGATHSGALTLISKEPL
ncbi:O-antigen ligase family protein [Candidatus Sumerlaeota bacterium]|nr:O-antigen ligase family protein [Candidatus Sumerlaeota bacterium]